MHDCDSGSFTFLSLLERWPLLPLLVEYSSLNAVLVIGQL